MTGRLKIHLKRGERIFINGAVVKVDRKVAFEFLNDVVFLLENHIIQEEQATTPLTQHYFIVQSMLMEPNTVSLARQLFEASHKLLIATFKQPDILIALVDIRQMVEAGRPFDALKKLRALFPEERAILEQIAAAQSTPARIVA